MVKTSLKIKKKQSNSKKKSKKSELYVKAKKALSRLRSRN